MVAMNGLYIAKQRAVSKVHLAFLSGPNQTLIQSASLNKIGIHSKNRGKRVSIANNFQNSKIQSIKRVRDQLVRRSGEFSFPNYLGISTVGTQTCAIAARYSAFVERRSLHHLLV
jgi:hypothetical protein